MALLIEIGQSGWITNAELRAELMPLMPGQDVWISLDEGDPAEITMLATSRLPDDLPAKLPNLQLVQKLGAGVETIVNHPALGPDVRVARLKPQLPAQEIAEYCLAYVLRGQRNMARHEDSQKRSSWDPVEPKQAARTTVGVLGLGHIGGLTARLMASLDFNVLGWSRSQKEMEGITCLSGEDGLKELLGQSDYVCAILPSTTETRALMDSTRLRQMKPGATLINCGRGDLVNEADLMGALDAGAPAAAVLDVVSQEPLPEDHPLWRHPKVTITPHVSGWHLGDALNDVAANYLRLTQGAGLLHEVDRGKGY